MIEKTGKERDRYTKSIVDSRGIRKLFSIEMEVLRDGVAFDDWFAL
jgi:hypothetical protein